ncbi:MAG: dTMP kinase [Alphaproteobacteria bacterium]
MFIAIDGIDGAGKTTLAQEICRRLPQKSTILEKEPTDYTVWGKRLKESAAKGRLPKSVEIEYFHKDRLSHIEKVINPTIKNGGIVIMDRYVDSTLAFQAEDVDEANALYEQFLRDILVPDVTLILDCPPEVGLERIRVGRSETSTFERLDTLKKAEKIYLSRQGPNYHHIDATGPIESTLRSALSVLAESFPNFSHSFDFENGAGAVCNNGPIRVNA